MDNQQATEIAVKKPRLRLMHTLIEYVKTGVRYVRDDSYSLPECTQFADEDRLTNTFLAAFCFALGILSHLKLEVVTDTDVDIATDLYSIIMNDEDVLYIGDVDLKVVRWNLDAVDFIATTLTCLIVLLSHRLNSSVKEYALLPWLGMALRGLLTRQAMSVLAVAYVFALAEEQARLYFSTVYALLFLVEMRLWMDTGRLFISRWRRNHVQLVCDCAKSKTVVCELERPSAT